MSNLIYQTISAVQAELASIGIAKTGRNQQQGYAFRGIDAVLNALAPILSKHKLCILPRCLDRTVVERQTIKGGNLFYVAVKVDFDFVAEDGSKHTVTTYGEAMDSADKATNKAMSAAYKYAAFQAFCIPTEETATDADNETHEVTPSYTNQMCEKDAEHIVNAKSIDAIKKRLKSAQASGAQDQHMSVLIPIATERKKELQAAKEAVEA